jgi:hypothetical protein
LRAGRRVSREQLKQDPRTMAYTGSLETPQAMLFISVE